MRQCGSSLARARILMTTLFYHFGIHCATHQIRIILISCIVITSLFYPALAIYSSSQPHSLATSWVLGSLTGNTAPALFAQHDLYDLWTGHDALRVREDAVSRARCGVERTLRVERILIQSPLIEEEGALNHQILLSTLRIEHHIAEILSSRNIPCLKKPNGHCFVLSPLAFWHHDKQTLMSDGNILDTLSLSKNISVAGIHVTPHMVLAGREPHERIAAKLHYAMFLALTYFFPETDCLGKSDHDAWLQLVKSAVTERVDLVTQAREPMLLALEYDKKLSTNKSFSAISTFLYLAYTGFFAYVTWSMRRMDAVHSRIGLTFTALVEIAVSTVTSLSVCALVGFKVTMVPWELLPIVIVFVGAENMFNLVDAVGKTSVTLPVKQRIAEGLKRAGTSNTLKVVSYNAILGVIAVLSVGAIRQFCAFAIVVLVAHWFLAHTFFMAVLSIDIQRLELDELLRQNASLAPSVPDTPPDHPGTKRLSTWRTLINVAQNMLGGKNISLFLLLAITATLYYTTYPASNHIDDGVDTSLSLGALGRRFNGTSSEHSPAGQIWKTLNPMADPLLHLRVEMPTILAFRPDIGNDQLTDHKAHRLRLSMRTLRLAFWLVRIVVLPIAVTTGTLYGLLLYLLKNAELLEAQQNHGEPNPLDVTESRAPLAEKISFSTLPRAFASDVELIAVSKDGNVVASVSIQNELIIVHVDKQSHISIDFINSLLRAPSTSTAQLVLTSLALDEKGQFCALGTGDGIIAVWALNRDSAQSLPHLTLGSTSSRIVELQFLNSTSPTHDQPSTTLSEPNFPSTSSVCLAAVYDNGVAVKWALGTTPVMTYLTPSRPRAVAKCMLLRLHNDEQLLAAHAMEDGTLELTEIQASDSLLVPGRCIQAGRPMDIVSKVHACRTNLGGKPRLIIGAVTEAGVVSIWDAVADECIVVLDDKHGDVTSLRISPIPRETCHYCGELPLENFCISLSVGHIILVYKAFISAQTRRCSCFRSQLPARDIIVGRNSRSNSMTSSVNSSPSLGRARLLSIPSVFDASPFPVSGHGVHSRRATEKDSIRRLSDSFSIPLPADENENTAEPPDSSPVASLAPHSHVWKNIILMRAADVSCERGSWDVSNCMVMGVRRKPRLPAKGNGRIQVNLAPSQGLTAATLERWELWTFDPSVSCLRQSTLVSLLEKEDESSLNAQGSIETVPRLPFTRVSPFIIGRCFGLAGFGNTVGLFKFSAT